MKRKFKRFISCLLLMTTFLTFTTAVYGESNLPNASGWAVAELTRADNDGFITEKVREDLSVNITREEFCEVAVILYDRLGGKQNLDTDNPFTDTTNPVVIKAYNAEIINGVGNNLFAPDANLTRQELAVMIVRAMTSAGIVFGSENNYAFQKTYSDSDSISGWAWLAVKIMNDFKIMNGSGDMLNPKDSITREQAIIMLERTYLREFEIIENSLTAYLGHSVEVTLPNGITSVADDALHGNEFIESIEFSDGITSIGSASFREMNSLTSLKLNEGLVTVGEAAFELNEKLLAINLPSSLETIEYMAFQDCISVTELTIPASVTTIGDQAFYRCTGLTRVVFEGDNIPEFGDSAFEECIDIIIVCNPGSDAEAHAIKLGYEVEYIVK